MSVNPPQGSEQPQPQPESRPVNTQGAVDLSSLAPDGQADQASAPAGAGAGASAPGAQPGQPAQASSADSWVISVSPQELQQVVQLSSQVPVIVLIHGTDADSERMRTSLEDLVDAQQGRVLMAEIDASSPEMAQAQGADQVPVATAFIGGRPVGEFDKSVPQEQLGQLVSQMVQLATQNGMTQALPPQSKRSGGAAEETEQELPPLHQKAQDALEQGDLDAAQAAYEEAIRENPGDEDAKLGLSQVQLMKRTSDVDLNEARQKAAENPDDPQAQIAVADVDVLGGHVEDAFARLVKFIQLHQGDDRETVRAHLVELYSVVGDSDPRVQSSRKQLARALF